jgi:hypothetical protein
MLYVLLCIHKVGETIQTSPFVGLAAFLCPRWNAVTPVLDLFHCECRRKSFHPIFMNNLAFPSLWTEHCVPASPCMRDWRCTMGKRGRVGHDKIDFGWMYFFFGSPHSLFHFVN